jgi:hypothetical protein
LEALKGCGFSRSVESPKNQSWLQRRRNTPVHKYLKLDAKKLDSLADSLPQRLKPAFMRETYGAVGNRALSKRQSKRARAKQKSKSKAKEQEQSKKQEQSKEARAKQRSKSKARSKQARKQIKEE